MPVFKQRRGTAAALAAANETPAAGQIYFETDTNRIKVGTGALAYNSLPYLRVDTTSVNGLQAALDSVSASSAADATSKANAAQAAAVQRANHTGTQAISTIVGLQSALDGKQAAGSYAALVHGHSISEVSGLQTALDGKQPIGSYAAAVHLHAVADVTGLQAALDSKQAAGSYAAATHTHSLSDLTQSGAATGQIARWNGTTWVPSTESLATIADGSRGDIVVSGSGTIWSLSSSVSSSFAAAAHTHTASAITDFSSAVAAASPEEVVEFLATSNFPATGNSSLLYIATDTSRAYRWTGSQYVEVGPATVFLATHSHVATDISDSTAAGRSLLTAADAAAQRTALGLGTMATATAADYLSLAGGTMTGVVQVAAGTAAAPGVAVSGDTDTGITQAGGANTLSVATAGVERWRFGTDGSIQSVIPGGASLLPQFACRAWVNFNGSGTVSIRGSGNVTSITDNGTGNYTVNFSNAMPDANYSAIGGWGNTDANAVPTTLRPYTFQAGSISFCTNFSSGSTQSLFDAIWISLAIFR